MKIPLPSSY